MIVIDCSIKHSASKTTSPASNLNYTGFSCNAEYQSYEISTARSTAARKKDRVRKKDNCKNDIELSFNQA